nr:radical SAM protein [Anaerovorax sp. IOR16]
MEKVKILFRISKHLDFLFAILPYVLDFSPGASLHLKLQTLIRQELVDISTEHPMMIGFSVITTQNSFSLWMAHQLKNKFQYAGSIVFGGSQPTKFEELYLKNNECIDFVVFGEGEEPLFRLIHEMKTKKNFADIPRLIYRDKLGSIMKNKNQKFLSNNYSFCFPDYDGLPLEKYLSPVFPIMGSTNCPWKKCQFCAHRTSFKEDYRERNPKDIVNEMKFMYQKYNIKIFHFADETMTKNHGVEISKIIEKERLPFLWMSFGRLDDEFDRSALEQLYRGGARVIEWGLESASDKVLKKMNKGISVSKAQEILCYAGEAGIRNKVLTWHNYPGEGIEDVIRTISLVEKNTDCSFAVPMLTLKQQLVLQVGSPLYDEVFYQDGKLKYFDKVWHPNSEYSINAKFYSKTNSDFEKNQVIESYLKKIKKYCDTKDIFIAFNENVTLDLLLCEKGKWQ